MKTFGSLLMVTVLAGWAAWPDREAPAPIPVHPHRIYLLKQAPWIAARWIPERSVLELERDSGELHETGPCDRSLFHRFLQAPDRARFVIRNFPELAKVGHSRGNPVPIRPQPAGAGLRPGTQNQGEMP